MCKCCQSCLEDCYWHCFEKWFCWDENIALYEDPLAGEKDRRCFDNVAFWDSVSVIANRAVVTIQPLPGRPSINSNPALNTPQLNENNTKIIDNEKDKKEVNDETNQPIDATDSPDKDKVKLRKQSAVEEKIEKRGSIAQEIKNRKKSLKERRKSAAGLTLKLDKDEIPVIRQSSMPRFFLETPEVDTAKGSYGSERSSVLMSPSLGNSPTFNYDLKSIVQIENEIIASKSKPSTPKTNRSSRLTQVRKKIKPIMIKKPSTKSLPDTVNHI